MIDRLSRNLPVEIGRNIRASKTQQKSNENEMKMPLIYLSLNQEGMS